MLMAEAKPGQTFTPGNKVSEPAPEDPKQPESQWQYTGDDSNQPNLPDDSRNSTEAISWTASEFIAHQKSVGWYLLLTLIAVGVSAGIYFITEDKITSVIILIVALMFGAVAARKPRVLDYEVSARGVRIGEKIYPYQILKSFSVIQEDAVSSVMLLPLRRFMPSIILYYPPEQEDEVLNALGSYLPLEQRSSDAIDKLMRKVRF
jgi:hypothetical protein